MRIYSGECSFDGCEGALRAKGYCAAHYAQLRKGKELKPIRKFKSVCEFEGCYLSHKANGYCSSHESQLRRGQELTPLVEKAYRYLNSPGYYMVYRPEHSNSYKSGYLPEHRYVMSVEMGRPLLDGENVHHKNGNRQDNRLNNLELWVTLQPAGQRVEDLLAYADEIISRYR